MKTCTMCKRELPVDSFDVDERYRSGYRSQCRECRYSRYKKHTDAPELCELCGESEIRRKRMGVANDNGRTFTRLARDHDHVTGKLRGWLCARCNIALGHFRDDPELCRKAAEYLERYR